jgi:hypothetical protein
MYEQHDDTYADPIITDRDVVGLYAPDAAAAAARTTMTDQGSGNWQTDD